jgi:hypothetical protein
MFSKVLICALTVFFRLVNTIGRAPRPEDLGRMRSLKPPLAGAAPFRAAGFPANPLGGLRIGATLSVIGAVVVTPARTAVLDS